LRQDAIDFLHRLDPTIPRWRLDAAGFEVLTGYLGPGYGYSTAAAERAIALPGLELETTYTAKTLAACLDDARTAPAGSNLLFWNSFNSASFATTPDLSSLPARIRSRLADEPNAPA
jgi:hypothetical protein